MQPILIGLLSISLLTNIPSKTITYIAPPSEDTITFGMTMPELVDFYADKHGVDKELAHYIVKNESQYNPEAKGDLDIICNNPRSPYNGQAVYARGLGQLTRCYYPDVSDDEAFDANTNLDITMGIIAKGKETCKTQFSTCRAYYHQNPS